MSPACSAGGQQVGFNALVELFRARRSFGGGQHGVDSVSSCQLYQAARLYRRENRCPRDLDAQATDTRRGGPRLRSP